MIFLKRRIRRLRDAADHKLSWWLMNFALSTYERLCRYRAGQGIHILLSEFTPSNFFDKGRHRGHPR